MFPVLPPIEGGSGVDDKICTWLKYLCHGQHTEKTSNEFYVKDSQGNVRTLKEVCPNSCGRDNKEGEYTAKEKNLIIK